MRLWQELKLEIMAGGIILTVVGMWRSEQVVVEIEGNV